MAPADLVHIGVYICIHVYIYIYIDILAKTRQYPLTVREEGSERKGNRSGKVVQEIQTRNSNKKFDQETLIGRLDQTILQRRAKLCAMCNIVQCGAVLRSIAEVVQYHAILCSCAQVFAELRNCTQ